MTDPIRTPDGHLAIIFTGCHTPRDFGRLATPEDIQSACGCGDRDTVAAALAESQAEVERLRAVLLSITEDPITRPEVRRMILRALDSPQPEPAKGKPLCPSCGGPLKPVTPDDNSALNREQFDAVRAGDFYCETCPEKVGNGSRARSGFAYFWSRDLANSPAAPPDPDGTDLLDVMDEVRAELKADGVEIDAERFIREQSDGATAEAEVERLRVEHEDELRRAKAAFHVDWQIADKRARDAEAEVSRLTRERDSETARADRAVALLQAGRDGIS